VKNIWLVEMLIKFLFKEPRKVLEGYKTYIFAAALAGSTLTGVANELVQYLANNISLGVMISHIYTLVQQNWTSVALGGGLAALKAGNVRAINGLKKPAPPPHR
jgi:hypothetical protein